MIINDIILILFLLGAGGGLWMCVFLMLRRQPDFKAGRVRQRGYIWDD